MAIRFKIFTDQRLIVACFTGAIVYENLVEWLDATYAHPEFSRNFAGLVDMRRARFIARDSADLPGHARAFADYMIKINFTTARWALLVEAPVETALSMFYTQGARKQHPIEVFSTVEAAEEYLGVPVADALKEMNG